ncbi:MAG: hypothetical protein IPK83_19310 [Planctomycetes bacterium]|nr:hypothetical protein [Planctomycetota bacterium]
MAQASRLCHTGGTPVAHDNDEQSPVGELVLKLLTRRPVRGVNTGPRSFGSGGAKKEDIAP